MPPRQGQPSERNRARRPQKLPQNAGAKQDNVGEGITGPLSSEIHEGQFAQLDGASAESRSIDHEQAFPVTPARSKDKNPKVDGQAHDSASETSRRPKSAKSQPRNRPPRTPKAQTPHPTEKATARPSAQPHRVVSEATPRLYAGPGFHASPAASSLPMPSFMSKSVPNVNKTTSLANMLEQTTEGSSNEEESPTKDAVSRHQPRQHREESPLDIFFKSDRAAKAGSAAPKPRDVSAPMLASPPSNFAHPSPFENISPRHHVRHHTDGSATGMFPLEMDTKSPQSAYDVRATNIDPNKPTTHDPLHDKSMALKKLLNFPAPPSTAMQFPPANSENPSTPEPKPRTQSRSSARLSGTPPLFPQGLDGKSPSEKQAALLALAEKQLFKPTPYPSQRPPSSSLRKEMTPPTSPQHNYPPQQHPQVPSTPTPSTRPDRQGQRGGSSAMNLRAPATTGHIPSSTNNFPAMHSGNAPRQPQLVNAAEGKKAKDTAMKSMEDDLRRILKLDGPALG